VRAPTGVEPVDVRVFGDDVAGGRVVAGDHWLAVPLDAAEPGRGSIEIYARELRAADRVGDDLPYLLFLQGGPGGRAPRPGVDGPGWLAWALPRYRVLLLDVPPVGTHPDDVYRATHVALSRRVAELDAAHPRARAVLADVAHHLTRVEEHLPTGERLTVERLQSIGVVLGGVGGPDLLAHLADDAWSLPGHKLSGTDSVARLPLVGEMIYPYTVERDPALAPLQEAAELLADRVWDEPLYDPDVLAANTVPVAACVYSQDMYVDPGLSRATAERTGGVRLVEDAVHHHDGLRRAGAEILGALEATLSRDGSHLEAVS
jgi:hypothetical protein